MNFIEKLTLPENLYWAWNKIRQMYIRGDAWYDPLELAHFEANLDLELHNISAQFKKLKYSNSPLKPLLHPKRDAEDKKPQARQAFAIATRDQVAWMAFANIVGPFIDYQMPVWSYGHRLYRSAWYEVEGEKDVLKIGRYRHSTGNFYRTFHQSWNRYRRHIYLTIRAMAGVKDRTQLDKLDQHILQEETYLPNDLQQPYLSEKYWQQRFTTPPKRLYWASIDFKLFYPSIKISSILENLLEFSHTNIDEFKPLAKSLLRFPLDTSGFTSQELDDVKISPNHSVFTGIPTGLFVAGFLANVAMLRIDNVVKKELLKKNIAHFRFVDDHVILAPNYEDLIQWINKYNEIIKGEDNGANIKFEKTAPPELGKLLKKMFSADDPQKNINNDDDKNDLVENAKKDTEIDPKFPSPLMTKTLTLVSDIARSDNEFDLLDSREQDHLITDIVHLLLTEFPEEELRAETRVTFAATRLSRLIPRRIVDNTLISDILRYISEQGRRKRELEKKIHGLCKKGTIKSIEVCQTCGKDGNKIDICKVIDSIAIEVRDKDAERVKLEEDARLKEENERKYNFSLLMKALHEYPQKLRMWTRILQFCQQVGHNDLQELVSELSYLSDKNDKTTAYIRAYVWNNLADQIIKCALVIVDDEMLLHKREAALRYLKAVISLSIAARNKDNVKYYEKISQQLFKFAVGVAVFIISTMKTKDDLASNIDITLLKRQVKKLGAFDLAYSPEQWAANTNYSLPDWTWWAENKTSKKDDNTPGSIWNMLSDKLDTKDTTTWSLWAKYPQQLPAIALKELLSQDAGFAQRYLSRQNEGWLYDVLRKSDDKALLALKRHRNPYFEHIRKARQKTARNISLDDWTIWTSKQNEKDPSDPRVSEWTALTIIYHVAALMTSFDPIHQNKRLLAIHPANIKIPQEWTVFQDTVLTWESWRDKIEPAGRVKITNENMIRDNRIVPIWSADSQKDIAWGPVRGLGMLLLGLLRRSFSWPSSWNPLGHQRAWSGLVGNQVQSVTCSSWTAAILEACLRDRPRESFLINELFSDKEYSPDEDTTLEPPAIYTVTQLLECVQNASNILRDYQLSLSNHMPRQLVPIRLEQLTRINWNASVEEADSI